MRSGDPAHRRRPPFWTYPLDNNLTVLIDFENVAAGAEKEGHGRFNIGAVMRRLADKGRILGSRAYGDWGRFAKYKQGLLEQGVQAIELTSYRGAEKNRADIALVVDAMELAYTRPYLDTFVLLSGDSDFTPLVLRLKELNKRVIGIGMRKSTSRLIIRACDEFIFYESIKREDREYDSMRRGSSRDRPERRSRQSTGRSGAPAPAESDGGDDVALSRDDAFALLVDAIEGLQRDTPGPLQGGLVKQSMKRKMPEFDEGEYGYAGFGRFLEAGRDRGIVALDRDQRAGGYRVDLPSGDDEPSAPSASGDKSAAPAPQEPIAPELDGEAGRLGKLLFAEGVHPMTKLIRHTVVHEFVDHVADRQKRNKRNTLMYVYGDVARRCRKTEPEVGPKQVRQVINAIKGMGALLHSDGTPVRSQTANFTLETDAEKLLADLPAYYARTLHDLGESMDDSTAMAELLFGDVERAQSMEELVAWVQHDATGKQVEPADGAPVSEEAPPAAAGSEE